MRHWAYRRPIQSKRYHPHQHRSRHWPRTRPDPNSSPFAASAFRACEFCGGRGVSSSYARAIMLWYYWYGCWFS